MVIERHGTPTAFDAHDTRGVKAKPHVAGDVLLCRAHKGIDGVLQRREPHAVIDKLCPTGLKACFLMVEVALEAQIFQVAMRGDQGQSAWAFVNLTALDPDAPVLHHVDSTKARCASATAHFGDQFIG